MYGLLINAGWSRRRASFKPRGPRGTQGNKRLGFNSRKYRIIVPHCYVFYIYLPKSVPVSGLLLLFMLEALVESFEFFCKMPANCTLFLNPVLIDGVLFSLLFDILIIIISCCRS